MSEFHAHLGTYEEQYQQPQTTSGLAIASLVCSLIICCPLITILGPILGAVSLGKIGPPPLQKGKGLAIAGILIGTITTAGGAIGGWQLFQWGFGYYEFVMEGPDSAMKAGAANDLNGFRATFHGPGATATDEEIQAFLSELESRYGAYVSTRFDEQAGAPGGSTGSPNIAMPYIMQFRDATVSADVELHFADETTGRQMKSLGYILIRDADRGDLRFPPLP